ncbi:MAG: endonuclease/exonuclease/phosphatase family protein [Nocardioidaceae bacterium]
MLKRNRGTRKALAAALACAVVAALAAVVFTAGKDAVVPSADAGQDARATSADIRVGSFNVLSVSLDRTQGLQRPWKQRRATVISQITGEHVDVIGVQEANPSNIYQSRLVDGISQLKDLRNGLNTSGGSFALTNGYAYNCANSTTSYKCRPVNRKASFADRILYNTKTVSLISQDSMLYQQQGAGHANLYLAWGLFRSKVNGHDFIFTSTHLDPVHRGIRRAQWLQMINRITTIRHGRPVISVGDFNCQKFDVMARDMLPAMHHAGLGDVLSQQYRVNPSVNVRAQKRINGWVNSLNHLSANVASFAYEDDHNKTGNSIDHVFAMNTLPVKEFKVVLAFNPNTLRVTGTLPSDHNMLRATITIP